MTYLEVANLKNELNTLRIRANALCLVTYMDYATKKVPKKLQDFYEIGERQADILDELEDLDEQQRNKKT